MNKKMTTFFFALPILLSSLAGCSSIGKSVDLSNFKLANLEEYSSIGYGAVTERGQGQKTQKKNASSLASTSSVRARYFGKGSGVDCSDSPFTLLGQTKASGIEKLSFTDGSGVSEDVHINAFACFGPFIAFRVGDSITYYEENVPSYEISLNSGLACDQYILSKKTGKIYSVADFGLDWPEVGYNSGSVNGVVYATIKYRPGSCYKIYEEGETLKFEKLFGSNVTFQGVDRYGNILTNVAIVTAKGETRMLSSYLSGHASITFNEELSRIVASDDGKSYVLDGNGDFVQGAYGRVSKVRSGFDIFDAETFNDLPEFPGVSGSSAKTWQEYLPKGEQGFGDVNYNNPRS